MFESVIHRAEVSVDNTIARFRNRVFVAVPFLVAAGFATAALALKLERSYGSETADIVLAGLFFGIGLVIAIALSLQPSTASPPLEPVVSPASTGVTTDAPRLSSNADRELLMATLTSVAPFALPGLVRYAMRNLPLLIAGAVAVFAIAQSGAQSGALKDDKPVDEPRRKGGSNVNGQTHQTQWN